MTKISDLIKSTFGVPAWDDSIDNQYKKQYALVELYDNADKVKLTCPKCNTTFTNTQRSKDHFPYRYCPNCYCVYDMRAQDNYIEYVWYNKDRETIRIERHTLLFNWDD